MNDLFIPKDSGKKISDLLKDKKTLEKNVDEVLVFASFDRIYVLPDFDSSPILIKARRSPVWSLCVHDNKLYDTGTYRKVYNTLDNVVVAERDREVSSLCSHEGNLYDAGADKKVYETMSGRVIRERLDDVTSLISFEDLLYDSGYYFGIHDTFNQTMFVPTVKPIKAMAVFDHDIYYSNIDEGFHVVNAFTDEEEAFRVGQIYSLCVFEGKLLDAGASGKIFDTLSGDVLFQYGSPINCMASVPKEILKDFV